MPHNNIYNKMKDTNAIEKALLKKINDECRTIANNFGIELEKLSNGYGGKMFYDFRNTSAANSKDTISFHVSGRDAVVNVIHRMIMDNHAEHMLKYKTKELLNKLELI